MMDLTDPASTTNTHQQHLKLDLNDVCATYEDDRITKNTAHHIRQANTLRRI